MKAKILGSAAGGGFPQWNCGCTNCIEVRRGNPRTRARTQDSLAVTSADGDASSWLLVNASPDVHRQIEANVELHPRSARHSPIAGVLLTNGDLDHVLGLFSLREWHRFVIYATESVWRGLVDKNAIVKTLQRTADQVTWRPLVLDETADDPCSGLRLTPFAAPGKLPLHIERSGGGSPSAEDNVGVRFEHPATKQTFVCVPAAGAPGDWLGRAAGGDVLVFDGTFWSSDELVRQNLGTARAEQMAHWPVNESVAAIPAGIAKRRVYTHVNNTNPLLLEGSPERREVERAGWEVAYDGMDLLA